MTLPNATQTSKVQVKPVTPTETLCCFRKKHDLLTQQIGQAARCYSHSGKKALNLGLNL
jgi:hypothetical protein